MTKEETMKWINVKDEKPEAYQRVLVYCKEIKSTKDILKMYSDIPFFNGKARYYCGCKGWD